MVKRLEKGLALYKNDCWLGDVIGMGPKEV